MSSEVVKRSHDVERLLGNFLDSVRRDTQQEQITPTELSELTWSAARMTGIFQLFLQHLAAEADLLEEIGQATDAPDFLESASSILHACGTLLKPAARYLEANAEQEKKVK